jgi:DNA end-binding protein Ku
VIREAMKKAGKVALGRLVMHQRERLMALEPRDKGILAYTIRNKREVRQADEIFEHIKSAKPPAQMIDIAAKIIDQLEGPFDPSQFNDRYEDALRALIKEKEKGHTVKAPEEPKEAEVIDLMEALKRSLGQSGGERRKTATKAPASHREPAAHKKAASHKKRA